MSAPGKVKYRWFPSVFPINLFNRVLKYNTLSQLNRVFESVNLNYASLNVAIGESKRPILVLSSLLLKLSPARGSSICGQGFVASLAYGLVSRIDASLNWNSLSINNIIIRLGKRLISFLLPLFCTALSSGHHRPDLFIVCDHLCVA